VELTVVMPCLNEAETVATCVTKAVRFIADSGISGEVVVADNGSTDGSQRLAEEAGARVVPVKDKGYGNALMGGILAARGEYVIMGDADDSYDFSNLMPFVTELRNGADLVMGNRFKGGIAPGAMPKLHRYLGNPVLSFVGRLFFRSPIGDFHCGLRGFRRDSALSLGLQATGMEFASEMVVKATLANQKIAEVPTTLAKDGRSRPPHLRSWRDGWRHLRFLLLFAPRWLFFIPGLALLTAGLVIGAFIAARPQTIGRFTFDVDTLVAASAMVVIGFQAVLFWLFTQVYAGSEGFLPEQPKVERLLEKLSLERGLLLGAAIGIAGLVGLIFSLTYWKGTGFGQLNYEHALRLMVPSVTALMVSCQVILGTFFLSILGIKQTGRTPIGAEAKIKERDEPSTARRL
jgi:glycosyltransferase involved in cell wall biosynthesis